MTKVLPVTIHVQMQTLVMRDVARYLGLGSPQAAERWLKAHQVGIFQDRLGYNRAYVREIDAAMLLVKADAMEAPRQLAAGE
jgi:hypothetical protein